MIGELLDGGCIERLFETGLQVLRDPAVAHPLDPVAIRVARRRHLSLGDLEVGHLSVTVLRISLIDPNDHFGCDRSDLVFIVDQVVACVRDRLAEAGRRVIDRLATAGAELVTTEMVTFEWLRTAEHPQFRDVLALIK